MNPDGGKIVVRQFSKCHELAKSVNHRYYQKYNSDSPRFE